MGRFNLDTGGQTLIVATGTGALFTDEARTASVAVGTLTTGGVYYCANGPVRLVLNQMDGTQLYSGTVVAPGTWDLPEVKVRPSLDQVSADLSRPRWDDLRVAVSTAAVAANAPTVTTYRDALMAYAFSKTLDNHVYFEAQLPHTWVMGSGVRPHVHWSPGASADTGNVRWQLEYSWANAVNAPGNTYPASTTDTIDQSAAGAYGHQIAQFAEIDGTGRRLSSVLLCRLSRLGSVGADTFDAVAFGLSVDFHIQVQGHGSDDEYPGA
jgi:hypothetical protein